MFLKCWRWLRSFVEAFRLILKNVIYNSRALKIPFKLKSSHSKQIEDPGQGKLRCENLPLRGEDLPLPPLLHSASVSLLGIER